MYHLGFVSLYLRFVASISLDWSEA